MYVTSYSNLLFSSTQLWISGRAVPEHLSFLLDLGHLEAVAENPILGP